MHVARTERNDSCLARLYGSGIRVWGLYMCGESRFLVHFLGVAFKVVGHKLERIMVLGAEMFTCATIGVTKTNFSFWWLSKVP